MQSYEVAVLGAVGGLIPDLLRLVKARHDGKVPLYLTAWFFWVSLLILSAMGAGTAYLAIFHAGVPNSVIAALAVGYGTPSVLSSLLGSVPGKRIRVDEASEVRIEIHDLRPSDTKPRVRRDAVAHDDVTVMPTRATGLMDWWGR